MKNNLPGSDNSFDDTYKEHTEMFGHPYQELQDYFKSRQTKGKLLDVGCGQGRDALFLASLGYEVTAVDSSKVGVEQMLHSATEKGIKINGIVDDVLDLQLDLKYDVILFDMLLHAFDKAHQQELLKKYSEYLHKNGIFCIVFPDDMRLDHFTNMLNSLGYKWNLLENITIKDIPKIEGEEHDFVFEMILVQLISRS